MANLKVTRQSPWGRLAAALSQRRLEIFEEFFGPAVFITKEESSLFDYLCFKMFNDYCDYKKAGVNLPISFAQNKALLRALSLIREEMSGEEYEKRYKEIEAEIRNPSDRPFPLNVLEVLKPIITELQTTKATEAAQKSSGEKTLSAEEEKTLGLAARKRKPPPHYFETFRLFLSLGNQEEVARKQYIAQGQVSRRIKRVTSYQQAIGQPIDILVARDKSAKPTDPDDIELGRRGDGLAKRQREAIKRRAQESGKTE